MLSTQATMSGRDGAVDPTSDDYGVQWGSEGESQAR